MLTVFSRFNDVPYTDPHERHIHLGEMRDYNSNNQRERLPVWAGEAVFAYAPDHWGCILADRTTLVDKRPYPNTDGDESDYLLRSELLACVALLRHQMNTPVWEAPVWRPGRPCKNPKFAGWALHEKPGLIRVTVVTFTLHEARVVQASCNASSPSPSLALSLRASYPRRDDRGFSEEVARKILRWLLGRDQQVPSMPGGNTASGTRVVSSGSDSSRASQPLSVVSDVSGSSLDDLRRNA